jgi:hypothetical protein
MKVRHGHADPLVLLEAAGRSEHLDAGGLERVFGWEKQDTMVLSAVIGRIWWTALCGVSTGALQCEGGGERTMM